MHKCSCSSKSHSSQLSRTSLRLPAPEICGLDISDKLNGRALMERVELLGAYRKSLLRCYPLLAEAEDQQVLARMHKTIMKSLLRLLEDDNVYLHRAAAHALKFEITFASRDILVDALESSKSPRVKLTILNHFREQGEKGWPIGMVEFAQIGGAIKSCLSSLNWQIRLFAVRCAHGMNLIYLDRELRHEIRKHFNKDPNPQVAAAAAITLNIESRNQWYGVEKRIHQDSRTRRKLSSASPVERVKISSRGYPLEGVSLSRDRNFIQPKRSKPET